MSPRSCLRQLRPIAFAVAALVVSPTALGAPFILTNGTGDGSVSIGVDGYGAFGSAVGPNSSNAVYNPVGTQGPAGTTFESYVHLNGPLLFLSSGSTNGVGPNGGPILANPEVTGTSTRAVSSFTINFLQFDLVQTLVNSFADDGTRVGTILNQDYTIRNLAEVPNTFTLTRYLDGDLAFDGSISDGGGRISLAGNEVLFETDAASGNDASTTFVGITSIGGTVPTLHYQISSFSGLRELVRLGLPPLNNVIQGDTDNNGFINTPYDVTLALRNTFALNAGQEAVYRTQTLFGNAVPPAPGSSEAFPLLPGNNEAPFVFVLDIVDPDDTLWADPIIAVGYDLAIIDNSNVFRGVTMPSTAVVPQSGAYDLQVFNGMDFTSVAMLAPGASFDFGVDVSRFRVLGIDPALMLDPNSNIAFPIGLRFGRTGTTSFSMTPITINTDPIGVPAPSIALLFAAALPLALLRRRRAA